MKATNLTISVPMADRICDKNCEYCISRMTGYVESNYDLMCKNLPKVRTLAERANVSDVLITGKGEPLLHIGPALTFVDAFKDYPLGLQTNGLRLKREPNLIDQLFVKGLDVLALSVDTLNYMDTYHNTIARAKNLGMTVRICLNLTARIPEHLTFDSIFNELRKWGADQILVRNIMVPDKIVDTEEAKRTKDWIIKNVDPVRYRDLAKEFERLVSPHDKIRTLPHGPTVWDYKGIAVTFSDYCIQENNKNEDIRSLIFLEDGHVYTSWDKLSSRLF